MNPAGTQTLETKRLILRRYTIDDAEDMYQNWASDPEVTRFLTWPAHADLEVTKHVLQDWIPRYEEGNYFNWAIELKETGAVIGNIAAVRLDEDVEAADVGYSMGKAYWNQGIMTEALRAVMDYLFDVVGLNRVSSYHDPDNPGSGRVMEKAGMLKEGVLRQAGRNNRGICDEVRYALLKSDREV
ncbi:MAG: GNAT family N-acetyltransferase [Lachnospiraceae bacterium]|nr:GNAT family N-acetyltransferase [Lachnospiraceae bacterium]